MHAERNSVPMMLTGIGLMTLGVVASGVGTGAMIEGRRECQSDRDPSRCVGESAPVNGGIAAIIGGSTLTVIGLGLTIAGAFKVVVPDRATAAPTLRVGLGSLSLSGTF